MTQNEVDILKNSVLDSTEAYVEARLAVLNFVKTQIGVTVGSPEKRADKKYYHTVRCNATRQNPNGITYNNVLSVGNSPFPANCVVFLVAPNAQFSNQFILGQLDDTPVNITAGSIALGGEGNNAPIYLTGNQQSDNSYGHISSFKIFNDRLQFTGTNDSISYIAPTSFRISEFKNVGGAGYAISLMMDGDEARFAVNTNDYPDGGLIVSNNIGWDNYGNFSDPKASGKNYIQISPTKIEYNVSSYSGTIGGGALSFLSRNQDRLANLSIFMDSAHLMFSSPYGTITLDW